MESLNFMESLKNQTFNAHWKIHGSLKLMSNIKHKFVETRAVKISNHNRPRFHCDRAWSRRSSLSTLSGSAVMAVHCTKQGPQAGLKDLALKVSCVHPSALTIFRHDNILPSWYRLVPDVWMARLESFFLRSGHIWHDSWRWLWFVLFFFETLDNSNVFWAFVGSTWLHYLKVLKSWKEADFFTKIVKPFATPPQVDWGTSITGDLHR